MPSPYLILAALTASTLASASPGFLRAMPARAEMGAARPRESFANRVGSTFTGARESVKDKFSSMTSRKSGCGEGMRCAPDSPAMQHPAQRFVSQVSSKVSRAVRRPVEAVKQQIGSGRAVSKGCGAEGVRCLPGELKGQAEAATSFAQASHHQIAQQESLHAENPFAHSPPGWHSASQGGNQHGAKEDTAVYGGIGSQKPNGDNGYYGGNIRG